MERLIAKRTSAFLIDGLLVLVMALVLPGKFWWWVGIGYFLLRDTLITGRSIGKFVVGLTVMDRQRNACGITKSIIRNLLLFLPGPVIEFFAVAFARDGRRLGDLLAGTKVIDTRPHIKGAWCLAPPLLLICLFLFSYRSEIEEWRRWERPRTWREVVQMEALGLAPRLKHVTEYFGWGTGPPEEDGGGERAQYVIHLRDGRRIEVQEFWDRGGEISYRKLGGIVGVDRKHVVMIENKADGTRKRY
jgi:hypothetical protein